MPVGTEATNNDMEQRRLVHIINQSIIKKLIKNQCVCVAGGKLVRSIGTSDQEISQVSTGFTFSPLSCDESDFDQIPPETEYTKYMKKNLSKKFYTIRR